MKELLSIVIDMLNIRPTTGKYATSICLTTFTCLVYTYVEKIKILGIGSTFYSLWLLYSYVCSMACGKGVELSHQSSPFVCVCVGVWVYKRAKFEKSKPMGLKIFHKNCAKVQWKQIVELGLESQDIYNKSGIWNSGYVHWKWELKLRICILEVEFETQDKYIGSETWN
jgi:hypothetical protein